MFQLDYSILEFISHSHPIVYFCLFVCTLIIKRGEKNKAGSFDSNAFILFKL